MEPVIENADDSASRANRVSVPDHKGIKVVKCCTIKRSAADLFGFWRRFENLPRFMRHLVSVKETSPTESHWVAKIAGKTAQWNSVVINENANELIAWRTLPGSDVAHAGSVRFKAAPDGRGTEVTLAFEYDPPTGKAVAFLAKLFGKEPGQIVEKDLWTFKAYMETGECPTTEGQSSGRASEKAEREKENQV